MMAAEKWVALFIPSLLPFALLIIAISSINYALRILKPVLDGDAASVEVTTKAEHDYAYWVQDALSKRVWNAGCVSVSRSCHCRLLYP